MTQNAVAGQSNDVSTRFAVLQVKGAANQQNRPQMQMQAPRIMQPPSYAPAQPIRDPNPAARQYPGPAPHNPNDQYRPSDAAYSQPPAMPDYSQQPRQQAGHGQGQPMQSAAPQFNYQQPAPADPQRAYAAPTDYGRGGPDAGRGGPDNSRAYDDGRRFEAAGNRDYPNPNAGNRHYANPSAQPLSPQSPSAAEAKKAAYRSVLQLALCTAACTYFGGSMCLPLSARRGTFGITSHSMNDVQTL